MNLPHLGVGVGFRPPLFTDIFLKRDKVDFLEIVADHYIDSNSEKKEELELLATHFKLIPHAIGLSLGSSDGINLEYLDKLAQLIEFINPPWWSEHISFTSVHGVDIGHLSPLPFCQETVELLCRNIQTVKNKISMPLILENITYLVKLPGATMSETEFISQVLENSDCGLLLDLTNVYTNSVNYKFCPQEFILSLPLERVTQFHFVGGHWKQDLLVDSHSQATPPEVWNLMEFALQHIDAKGIILERDSNFPNFDEITTELNRARNLWTSYGGKISEQ